MARRSWRTRSAPSARTGSAPGDPAAVAAAFVVGANAEAPVAALGAGVPQAGVQRLGSMGMLFLSVPVVRA